MSRYYFEEAIILRYQRIEDANLLLTLYGRSKGKYNAIAPGALKIKNRLRGKVEPFTWGKGYFVIRKNLDWLINWEVEDIYWDIRTDLKKLNSVVGIVNIIEKNTSWENPDENLFQMLLDTLKLIREKNPEHIKEIFFIKFLQSQGLINKFSPICGKCDKLLEKEDIIRLNVSENKVYCKNCSFYGVAISLDTLESINKILTLTLSQVVSLNILKEEFEKLIKEYENNIL
ncbi:MAG: DNA repair protein RecO [Dictyoglomaceae bacterium]